MVQFCSYRFEGSLLFQCSYLRLSKTIIPFKFAVNFTGDWKANFERDPLHWVLCCFSSCYLLTHNKGSNIFHFKSFFTCLIFCFHRYLWWTFSINFFKPSQNHRETFLLSDTRHSKQCFYLSWPTFFLVISLRFEYSNYSPVKDTFLQ